MVGKYKFIIVTERLFFTLKSFFIFKDSGSAWISLGITSADFFILKYDV